MLAWRLVVTLLLSSAIVGCSGDKDANNNAAPAPAASVAASPETGLTEEVQDYAGEPLPLDEYKRRVNAACRDAKDYVLANPRPDGTDEQAVVSWAEKIVEASVETYQTIALLRPPEEKEVEIRSGFLAPYYRQLNAFERLYVDLVQGQGGDSQALAQEALEAKREFTIYAAKNDLTDCVG